MPQTRSATHKLCNPHNRKKKKSQHQVTNKCNSRDFTALSIVVGQQVLNARRKIEELERLDDLAAFGIPEIKILGLMLNYISYVQTRNNHHIPAVAFKILFQNSNGRIDLDPVFALVNHKSVQRCRHMLARMGISTVVSSSSCCDDDAHVFYSKVITFSDRADATADELRACALKDVASMWGPEHSLQDPWFLCGDHFLHCSSCGCNLKWSKDSRKTNVIMATCKRKQRRKSWVVQPFLYNQM